MTNEEAMRILRVASERRMRCDMTDKRAAEVLAEMISMEGLSGEQLIALGIAAGYIESGIKERWWKTSDKLPMDGELIVMAVLTGDEFMYYVGSLGRNLKDNNEWYVQLEPDYTTITILYDEPDYWRYLIGPER